MEQKKRHTKVDELREAYAKRSTPATASKPPSEEERPGSSEDLEAQIRSAEEEAKSHYDKLLRVMAEFENFKKRIQKEKDEHLLYSNEKLITDMLPVLDDFDRILDHLPQECADDVAAIAEGVRLVQKNMIATLEKYGLKEISALDDTFNPALHEAIATTAAADTAAGMVVTVHRKGYLLNDRLLRAAMVTVAA